MIVVNPNGNGLTNGNLALATATAAQVLSGYTFYAGDKELKTGTLVTPKVSTGTFNYIGYEEKLTISCGFQPVLVVVRINNMNSYYHMAGYCYENSSFISGFTYNSGFYATPSNGIITINANGFVLYNTTVYGSVFPFYNGTETDTYTYVAIG